MCLDFPKTLMLVFSQALSKTDERFLQLCARIMITTIALCTFILVLMTLIMFNVIDELGKHTIFPSFECKMVLFFFFFKCLYFQSPKRLKNLL